MAFQYMAHFRVSTLSQALLETSHQHRTKLPVEYVSLRPPPRSICQSRLEKLPSELGLMIYELACTDDGRTGAALSRVSRTIRDDSAPRRFHTVAVFGLANIQKLCNILYSLPYGLRIIQHLFLTDSSSMPYHGIRHIQGPSGVPHELLRNLLQMVSHSLRTLSIHILLQHRSPPLSVYFPHLSALAVNEPVIKLPPHLLPSLHHLHVRRRCLPTNFFTLIPQAYPRLDHLQVAYGGSCDEPRMSSDLVTIITSLGFNHDNFKVSRTGLTLRNISSKRPVPEDIPPYPLLRADISAETISTLACQDVPGFAAFFSKLNVRDALSEWLRMVNGEHECCDHPQECCQGMTQKMRATILSDLWNPFK